jgi:hypothetical protein
MTPTLEQAAARGFQYRELGLRRRQHAAVRPIAGAVADRVDVAIQRDALRAGAAGAIASQLHRMRDHQRGGGLAVGASNADYRNTRLLGRRAQLAQQVALVAAWRHRAQHAIHLRAAPARQQIYLRLRQTEGGGGTLAGVAHVGIFM